MTDQSHHNNMKEKQANDQVKGCLRAGELTILRKRRERRGFTHRCVGARLSSNSPTERSSSCFPHTSVRLNSCAWHKSISGPVPTTALPLPTPADSSPLSPISSDSGPFILNPSHSAQNATHIWASAVWANSSSKRRSVRRFRSLLLSTPPNRSVSSEAVVNGNTRSLKTALIKLFIKVRMVMITSYERFKQYQISLS